VLTGERVALLVATTNAAKLREIRPLLADLPLDLVTLADWPAVAPAPEEGPTFLANARAKARHYARATGLLTVGEDSGLEIAALDGAPGVQSARFDGPTYPEKFRAIYAALEARHCRDSPARFVCAVALARGEDLIFETIETVEGRIAPEPRGTGGFGYDPIFFYPPYGCTLAEVSPEAKAAVSHRGRAFRQLRAFLLDYLAR
jgi:XTP/dITP diphosphohydrolase